MLVGHLPGPPVVLVPVGQVQAWGLPVGGVIGVRRLQQRVDRSHNRVQNIPLPCIVFRVPAEVVVVVKNVGVENGRHERGFGRFPGVAVGARDAHLEAAIGERGSLLAPQNQVN